MRRTYYQVGANGQATHFINRPMTNAERQAAFVKRHPGYYQKYKAQYRARRLQAHARVKELYRQAEAIEAVHQALFAPMRLALPAPTVPPLMEEINQMRQKLEREGVVVRR
jgi:hypothetical protein